jgi:uncharacterized membrane protein YccC
MSVMLFCNDYLPDSPALSRKGFFRIVGAVAVGAALAALATLSPESLRKLWV